tara:strand:- start:811 stop:975 length:165 start_codon:yes stop_codon:yes gene_type:complete
LRNGFGFEDIDYSPNSRNLDINKGSSDEIKDSVPDEVLEETDPKLYMNKLRFFI